MNRLFELLHSRYERETRNDVKTIASLIFQIKKTK
jgi:hypothetical protein